MLPRGQSPAVQQATLTFAEVERIIGAPLLPSASLRARWPNSPGGLAWAWLSAGWRVRWVTLWLAEPTVTFVRVER